MIVVRPASRLASRIRALEQKRPTRYVYIISLYRPCSPTYLAPWFNTSFVAVFFASTHFWLCPAKRYDNQYYNGIGGPSGRGDTSGVTVASSWQPNPGRSSGPRPGENLSASFPYCVSFVLCSYYARTSCYLYVRGLRWSVMDMRVGEDLTAVVAGNRLPGCQSLEFTSYKPDVDTY